MKTSNTIIAVMLAASPLLSACNPSFSLNPCDRELKPSQLYKQILPSVALINTGNGLGSAFIVKHENEKTYLLTNSHVAAGKIFLDVHWPDKTKERGKVVGDLMSEQESDMALIEVEGLRGKPLTIDNKLPEIGEDIIAVGAPQGLDFTMTRGIVSQLRKDNQIIQIDAPVNPGNSGGPLFTSGGCVSGMVTFKKEDSEGLNFAIAPTVLSVFLDSPTHRRFDDTAFIKSASSFVLDVDSVERLLPTYEREDFDLLKTDAVKWVDYRKGYKDHPHSDPLDQAWAPGLTKKNKDWSFIYTRMQRQDPDKLWQKYDAVAINCEEGLIATITPRKIKSELGQILRKMGKEWWSAFRHTHALYARKLSETGKVFGDDLIEGEIEDKYREWTEKSFRRWNPLFNAVCKVNA